MGNPKQSSNRRTWVRAKGRLDQALREADMPEARWMSRNSWKKLFEIGAIRDLSGKQLRAGEALESDLEVEVQFPGPFFLAANSLDSMPPEHSIENIYLNPDNSWGAFAKPAGMPIHSLFPWEVGSFAQAVGQYLAREKIISLSDFFELGPPPILEAGLVQRLDNDTSGIVLVATKAAQKEKLRQLFTDHKIEKTYLAVVVGDWKKDIEVESFELFQTAGDRVAVVGAEVGNIVYANPLKRQDAARPVDATIRCIAKTKKHSVLQFTTHAGVRHQVRAVCARLGFPLYGDRTYFHVNTAISPEGAPAGHLLHAAQIKIPPGSLSLEEIVLKLDMPEAMQCHLRNLGIY